MSLVGNVFILIAAAVPMIMIKANGRPLHSLGSMAELFIVTGAAGINFFGLMQPMSNRLAYDRDGFRCPGFAAGAQAGHSAG